MKPAEERVRKILVVTLSNLGDVVLTLPVFASLSKAFPRASMDVVVGPASAFVFEGDARIRRVVRFDKKRPLSGKAAFLREVRGERYDLIVDLRHSLIGFLGGARFRNRYFSPVPKTLHRFLRHRKALEGLAAPTDVPWLKAGASPLPGPGPWVVAAVGSKSDVKRWPAAHYARLLDKLALNDGRRIALVGDAKDAEDARRVRGAMLAESVDLTGKTDFAALCGALAAAELVVTNDSAPLHLAEALGRPVLALFGPTDPRKYGPRGARSAAVSKPLFCSPCEKAQCRFGSGESFHPPCLKELYPEEVYARARALLAGPPAPAEPRILAVRLDRIGDLVLTLPALAEIKKRFPRSHLALMVRPSVRALVEGHPLVDEVIPYLYEKKGRHSRFGNFHFIREIRSRRFDKAFILHPSNRSMLVPFLAGIPERVGFRAGASFLLTRAVPDRRHEGDRHESEYTLDIVREPGPATAASPPRLTVDPEEARRYSGLRAGFEGRKVIALHPGASCASKRWPVENFAALGRRILAETPYRLAVVGGAGEAGLGRTLSESIGRGTVDLTGRLDLKELAFFLKDCEALVSNDSGPVHVASAVGTRVVSIFGRTARGLSARRWGPLGQGRAVQKDVGCVVCLAHRCTIGFECLKALGPDEVFEALRGLLSEKEAAT
ncbi:MAG TPA: lipopolysaccharide heptosyltransferase II [Candidatus Eisenbacteria bacterium]|nr:lipopolysaccharide heptosyltransferase II [Candidatus Eisenbacteria bacterium]